MEKCMGYDNSACCISSDSRPLSTPATMEMERVVSCGNSKTQNNSASTENKFSMANDSGDNKIVITPNECQPKCPAVTTSPWDPMKTRFAAFLTLAIVVWLLIGVCAINFQK
ncbi:Hypothetical protein CINCED_3A000359 [Cinara cedri]|uniref:Uncharacterized protein n=1 Tax=Cinara cedri TaxID=506608 RepID=A0A5E4M9H7_9HEMI|nr:Hypothetical protein CINCED_3A000359 [Cinara cedri]